MSHFSCPECGFSFRVRLMAPVHCPRCRVRRGEAIELVPKAVRAPTAMLRRQRVTRALSTAQQKTAMDVAVLGEVQDGREVVRFIAGDGASFGLAAGVSTPLDATFCQRLLDGRMSGIVRNAQTDEAVRDLELTRIAQVGAYIGVTLTALDARLYVLCCLAHEQRPSLSERDLSLLRGLGKAIVGELGAEPAA